MIESHTQYGDQRIEKLFQALPGPTVDQDFTAKVMHSVKRRIWLRRAVLAAAIIIGGSIALGPAAQILNLFCDLLIGVTINWSIATTANDYLRALPVLVVVLLWPGALRWMTR